MNRILKYFPYLTDEQRRQLSLLQGLYSEWNSKINVISRKDMEHFQEHHVLHSLSIAKVTDFPPSTQILDVGTGGGFPGVPLAILFPQAKFHLVDSIGKKIRVVNEVVAALGLKNVTTEQARAEALKGQYDFVISRAVTTLPEFHGWVKKLIAPHRKSAPSSSLTPAAPPSCPPQPLSTPPAAPLSCPPQPLSTPP
ncbi:MAG: 16S rRNA (guanine(527)-N(7))-methyltransferase RsmG, partial [Bacteroidales bacterium]|nr:16S rRNA (guanine(527)-N(7))-methyltransferase RsmG [Bacteroidales bacterium]